MSKLECFNVCMNLMITYMPLLFVDIQLVNNTLRTITVSDCFDCVAACLAEPHCCSVNFKLADDLSICNLNRRCRRETVEDGCLMKTERSIYFELSDTKGRSPVRGVIRVKLYPANFWSYNVSISWFIYVKTV